MARLTPEQLEQKIHAVLREQPTRRAPMSLEARVLGEIAWRQALPWWNRVCQLAAAGAPQLYSSGRCLGGGGLAGLNAFGRNGQCPNGRQPVASDLGCGGDVEDRRHDIGLPRTALHAEFIDPLALCCSGSDWSGVCDDDRAGGDGLPRIVGEPTLKAG